MTAFLTKLWKEEEGAETAEWILVAGLLVGVGIAIYTGILQETLSSVTGTIGSTIAGVVP